jgi:hypothetical protein
MVVALVVAGGGFVPSAVAQTNGARLGIGPDMPSSTTVGATNVGVYISLTNLSDPADGQLIIPANGLTFTPSCGTLPPGAVPPCPAPDLGVFAVGSTGTGRAGSDCAGQSYAITQDSAATGAVVFDGPAITLTASNPTTLVGGSCVIDFTVSVLKAPSIDADPATPGIQTYQLADASGWHTQQNNSASCCGSSHTTVAPASPSLSTHASAGITLGGSFTDTAVLAGGVAPTGTVTFSFFPPGDTTCAAPPASVSPPVPVNGNGSYTSAPYTPTQTGTYLTVATYSGDHNNAGLTTGCNAAGESVVVSPPAAKPAPSPVPKAAPSTSVLGATFSRTPTLPVTGPSVPVVPLLVAGAAMVLAGAGLLWRARLRS